MAIVTERHTRADNIGGLHMPDNASTSVNTSDCMRPVHADAEMQAATDTVAAGTSLLRDDRETSAGTPLLNGAPPRILLADDNADRRDYVKRLLSAVGIAVEAVADGRAALRTARQRRPDLILSEIMMPNLGGLELLRELRPDTRLKPIPIILLSARVDEEIRLEALQAGADDCLTKPFSARELIARVSGSLRLARIRGDAAEALRDEARTLEILNRIGATIAAELDLEKAVQAVTDSATELTGAAFGAFFYNVFDEHGERYMLYTLSGAPRAAFARFPLPRNTGVFAPTFGGEGIVRSDDITKEAQYGKCFPHFGMPKGHLPVRSYLAAPVISRSGEVLGGLFFGHPEAGIFGDRSERVLKGIANYAAIAIDNARVYQSAEKEIAARKRAEEALREREERLSALNSELSQRLAALQTANAEIRDTRRAALDLMEDAVAARKNAERLTIEVGESERRFRDMIDALPAAVYTTDAEGRITHFNPAAVAFSGRTPELGTDKWCVTWKLYHPDGTHMPHDECPMAIALKGGRAIWGAEAILERPDGQRRWFTPFPTPLRDADGRIVGGINMLVDITERKMAEQRQQLLSNELAHRSKNLLAVMQAIASFSFSGTKALVEARDRFTKRIQALARSQTLLVNGALEGASFAEIIRFELEAFSDRVKVAGPDVMLNARSAQTFALVVHELATNATKHGSLSRPEGRVDVEWSIDGTWPEAHFRFRWSERDGPPVVTPTRRGFGRTLVEKAVGKEFGTRPQITFNPQGLVYEIDVDLPAISISSYREDVSSNMGASGDG
jgi:PAS domain S-box-containing protein